MTLRERTDRYLNSKKDIDKYLQNKKDILGQAFITLRNLADSGIERFDSYPENLVQNRELGFVLHNPDVCNMFLRDLCNLDPSIKNTKYTFDYCCGVMNYSIINISW